MKTIVLSPKPAPTPGATFGLRVKATGVECKIGDQLTDFRGDKAVLTGWPKNGRNRVWVDLPGRGSAEFFPSVYGLEIFEK